MNRETSRGVASVLLACEAFGISRQAYYAALRRSEPMEAPDWSREAGSDEQSSVSESVPEDVCGAQRPGTWATTEELRVAAYSGRT